MWIPPKHHSIVSKGLRKSSSSRRINFSIPSIKLCLSLDTHGLINLRQVNEVFKGLQRIRRWIRRKIQVLLDSKDNSFEFPGLVFPSFDAVCDWVRETIVSLGIKSSFPGTDGRQSLDSILWAKLGIGKLCPVPKIGWVVIEVNISITNILRVRREIIFLDSLESIGGRGWEVRFTLVFFRDNLLDGINI